VFKQKCDSLLLLHLGYINHSEYKVTVKLDNTDEVTNLFESITLEVFLLCNQNTCLVENIENNLLTL